MHSLIHEQYVRAQHAERVAHRGWMSRRPWRRPPPPPPPPRPPGRGGGALAALQRRRFAALARASGLRPGNEGGEFEGVVDLALYARPDQQSDRSTGQPAQGIG